MLDTAITNSEPKTKLTQKRAAELLGVTKFYLNRVLRGHLRSRRLTERYQKLVLEYSPQAGSQEASVGTAAIAEAAKLTKGVQ